MRRLIAQPGIKIVDIAERQAMGGETQFFQNRFQHIQGAGILGRHRRAADQGLGQGKGVNLGGHQSRNNSLIEVLARVFSSTRLTITAQYRFGPLPDGNDPDTTTE